MKAIIQTILFKHAIVINTLALYIIAKINSIYPNTSTIIEFCGNRDTLKDFAFIV